MFAEANGHKAPTESPDDNRLKPITSNSTTVKIGEDFGRLASLHFIQDLQLPRSRLPFVTSITFYAPGEIPIVPETETHLAHCSEPGGRDRERT